MKPEEIRKECEEIYATIKTSQERLDELRKACTHKTTFIGNYSYRIGQVSISNICLDCGELIN
jgi:hypothetical protein